MKLIANDPPGYLSRAQVRHLRTLITRLVKAESDASWAGAQDAQVSVDTRTHRDHCKRVLDQYLDSLKLGTGAS